MVTTTGSDEPEDRPAALRVLPEGIPDDLKQGDRWVVWKYERTDKGKWTKVPYGAVAGPSRKASSTDSRTWVKYATAQKCYSLPASKLDGVGFVLGDGYCGVDLDDAIDLETGLVKPWAEPILERFSGTYTEVSPSGTGYKIFCRGKCPTAKHKVWIDDEGEVVGAIECYDGARYFTVTGRREGEAEGTADMQEQLDWLYGVYFRSDEPKRPNPPSKASTIFNCSDAEILDKAYNARNGDRLRRLMEGDSSGYESGSEADLALAGGLAFWFRTPDRIAAVMRGSGLAREKWGREDYLDRTIAKAMEGRTEFYEPRGAVTVLRETQAKRNTVTVTGCGDCKIVPHDDIDEPIDKGDSIPGWQPFPVECLPQPLKRYVREFAAALGCDESLIALSLLGAVAGAIGNTRRVRLKKSWTEPAVLWSVGIGESGSGKSPANDAGTKPVVEAQREARKHHKREMAKYIEARDQWDGEGEEPEAPPDPPAYWIDNATMEAVGGILHENDRGTMVIADELAAWFGSFDAYRKGKGSDGALWLRMHGGREVRIDRKTGTPKTVYIPHASVSVVGTIQPGILRKYLTAENRQSGMAARLLMAWPPRRPFVWTEDEPDDATVEAVCSLFLSIYNLDLWQDTEGERRPFVVPLSFAAKRLWIEFYNAHGEEHAAQSGDMAAAYSKLIGYAARFALLFATVRSLTGESESLVDEIDPQSMADAIRLARWFTNEATRIYRLIDAGAEQQDRHELIDWIRQRGGTATIRDLQNGGPAKLRKSDLAERALRDLSARGIGSMGVIPAGPRGGRPSEVFTLKADA